MIYPFATRDRGKTAIGDTWSYALELEGRRVELEEGEVLIGRSRSCAVTLRDPSASRNHVLVLVQPGDVRARDLQSSNGTYVNGQRLVDERQLHDGDVITIGETEIHVHIEAPEQEAAEGATVRLDDARVSCPVCGAQLPVHADFCSNCGHRMGASVAAGTVALSHLQPPPASAPAMPPPLPPAMSAPPMPAPPPPSPPMGAPPMPPPSMGVPPPFAPPSVAARDEATGELLPALGDEVFATPGPMPPFSSPPAPLAPPAAPLAPPRAAQPFPLPPPGRGPLPMTAPSIETPPLAPAAAGLSYRPAGFWIRLAAVVLDAIWIGALLFVAALPFGGVRSSTGSLVASVVSLLLFIVVPVLGWGVLGATPGKFLLGLRVIGGGRRRGLGIGRAFLRLCGMMVSSAVLGIGFLMVAFTRDKRALHDLLAETAVMRR